eukprot:Transcript_7534.p1 GENE.Transcript_7534~~Transcript_7534.p1  ORF type:complete len:345 (-),score=113.56 Transcript_7534:161-1162(-)
MVSDLPGGGKKPRTATPLAWRLVYLVIGSVIGWSFLSTRAASAAIATDLKQTHSENLMWHESLLDQIKSLRHIDKSALTTESARSIIDEALAPRMSKMSLRLDGLEQLLPAMQKDVEGLAPAVLAAMRKEFEAQDSVSRSRDALLYKRDEAVATALEPLKASIESLKASHAAALAALEQKLEAQAREAQAQLQQALATAAASASATAAATEPASQPPAAQAAAAAAAAEHPHALGEPLHAESAHAAAGAPSPAQTAAAAAEAAAAAHEPLSDAPSHQRASDHGEAPSPISASAAIAHEAHAEESAAVRQAAVGAGGAQQAEGHEAAAIDHEEP